MGKYKRFFKHLFRSSTKSTTSSTSSQIKVNNLKITTMDLTGQVLAAGASKTLSVLGTDDAGVEAPISDPSFSVSGGNVTLAPGVNSRSQVVTSVDGGLATVSVTAFPINADGSVDNSVSLTATLSINDVAVVVKATRLVLQFN